MLKCLPARSGVREPSGDFHSMSRSTHSTQPPGTVFLGGEDLVSGFWVAVLGCLLVNVCPEGRYLLIGSGGMRDFSGRTGHRANDLLKALTHQTRPVANGRRHEAAVDIVEFLIISPSFLRVIDLEAYVWRYPRIVGGIS